MEGTFQTRASCIYSHRRPLQHSAAGHESSAVAAARRVLPAPAGSVPEQDWSCLSSRLPRCSYSLVTARAPTAGLQPAALRAWQLLLRHTAAASESSFASPSVMRERFGSPCARDRCCNGPSALLSAPQPPGTVPHAQQPSTSPGCPHLQPPFVVTLQENDKNAP